MNDPLKEALVVATQKLNEFVSARAEIDKQRAEIDTNIIHWKQVVDSLRTVCTEEDEEDPSDVEVSAFAEGNAGKRTVKFTDGVRMVLRRNRNTALTVPEIRNGLLNLGFDFSKYRQPLTPIHNCLKRLEEQGEVIAKKTPDGQILGYTWISSIERALAEDTPKEPGYYVVTAQHAMEETKRFIEETNRLREQEQARLITAVADAKNAVNAEKAQTLEKIKKAIKKSSFR